MISPTNRVIAAIAVVVVLTFTTQSRGQTPTAQTWNNASGDFVWNQGGNSGASTGFNDWTNSSNSGTWDGGFDNATFGTTGAGTITVDGSGTGGAVTAEEIFFTGGNHTFTGDPIYRYSSTALAGGETFIQVNSGSGTIKFSDQIVLGDLSGGNEQANINSNSTTNITLTNIDFGTGTYTGSRRLNLNPNGSTMTLDGAVTASGGHGGQINFNTSGIVNLTANADFTNFTGGAINSYAANTFNFYTSKFTSAQTIGINVGTGTFNLIGAQNIPLAIYDSTKHGSPQATDGVNITYGIIINQTTTDISSWTGSTNLDGSNMTLTAVAGSRLNMGYMHGDAPSGLVISGAGTVVLASATGNLYDEKDGNGNLQPTSTVAATLKSGSTTLITNTSGSAFGFATNGSAYYGNTGTYNFPVQIESGAILGGTGISTNPIQALTATSVIAPGDFGQANLGIASSIGTLHLNGGIVATNGLTMDFKLNGLVNDAIDFGGSTFNFDNVVTINLTGTPVISAANDNGTYKILTGLNVFNSTGGQNLDFEFTAPAGYQVVDSGTVAGPVNGLGADAGQDYFYVKVAATPEPSAYGLMGLGLLTLLAVRRFRRLNA